MFLKKFFVAGCLLGAIILSGCGSTVHVNVVGATKEVSYDSSIQTFEKVGEGMTISDLEKIDLGPSSPGVATVVFDTGRKNIRLQTSQGELTPLPFVLKEQCIEILSQSPAKECFALLIERSWEVKTLISSQFRRLLGHKRFEGEKKIFRAIIFISPTSGVVYKATLEMRAQVPIVQDERDYYKPLDGLPTSVFGTIIGGAISSGL